MQAQDIKNSVSLYIQAEVSSKQVNMSQESEEFRLEMYTWEMLDVNCIRTRKLDEIDKEANSDRQKFKGPPYLEERTTYSLFSGHRV